MKLAIVGSRNFPNLGIVAQFVGTLPQNTTVISGGARGVDKTAANAARENGLNVREYLPDWNQHGKAAGFIRNEEIVSAADRLVAFWDGHSRGTHHAIETARSAGLTVTIYRPDGSHFDEAPTYADNFDDTDPQHGATREEYEEIRAVEDGDDHTPPLTDRFGIPKVRLTKTALKWVCAAKPKERTTKSGRTLSYFTQCFFTVLGNRLIATYDSGTAPMPAGPGRGIVVEVYGRTINEETNDDNTMTVFVIGAEIVKTGTRTRRMPATKPAAPATTTAKTPEKPKLTPEARARITAAVPIRREIMQLKRELQFDDTLEDELRSRIVDLTLKLSRIERGEEAPDELRRLVAEQLADDTDTVGEIFDTDASDKDASEPADGGDAETIEHDEDGAELDRATEPWADSSTPVGATVDEDCYICPARLGAACTRHAAGQACLLAA